MGWSERLQRWLLVTGSIIAAVLLIRFAFDFSKAMPWWLALPFCMLVAGAILLASASAPAAGSAMSDSASHSRTRLLLLVAIPAGFLASSLDCTGLSLNGCSPFCTFIKLIWVPLIALGCAITGFTRKRIWLSLITLMLFVPLIPHCVCRNVANVWWIELFGSSPMCYAWGFASGLIAIGALVRGTLMRISLSACLAITAGATAFFLLHHYLHFPW